MRQKLWLLFAFSLLWTNPAGAQLDSSMDLQLLVPEISFDVAFAHDYGYYIKGVTYKGVDYNLQEATREILPQLDWMEREDKLELGTAWVKALALHGTEVLEEGHKRLPEAAEGPKAEFLEDGTFQYSAWVMVLTGRSPGGVVFKQVKITPEYELIVE